MRKDNKFYKALWCELKMALHEMKLMSQHPVEG